MFECTLCDESARSHLCGHKVADRQWVVCGPCVDRVVGREVLPDSCCGKLMGRWCARVVFCADPMVQECATLWRVFLAYETFVVF